MSVGSSACTICKGPWAGRLPVSALLFILAAHVTLLAMPSDLAAEGAQTEDAGDGWALLWGNRLDDAILRFERDLDQNDKDLDARRGLTIALLARGHERRAVESVLELRNIKEVNAIDFLLASWIYESTITHGKDEKEFQKLFEGLAGNRTLHVLDRRVVEATAARFAMSNGDRKKAAKIAEGLHRIEEWSILGPFDNTSGRGHSKDHLGTRKDMEHQTYVGKAGQEFEWHTPKRKGLLRVIDFDNHLARSQNITAYAGTRCIVPSSGTYLLSVTKAGAMTVELDGTTLIELDDDTEQNEFYHFEVDLGAGSHTFLFKVSGEDHEPSVAASLSTLAGEQCDELSFSPLVPGTVERNEIVFRRRPLPLTTVLEAKAKADTTDPAATFWWLIALDFFNLEERGREWAIVSEGRFSDSAVLRLAIGTAFLRAGDEDCWRAQMRKVASLDPQNALAAHWQAQEYIRRELYTQSDSLLQDLAKRCPGFLSARVTLLNSYRSRGLVDKLVPLAERLISAYPDYATFHRVLAEHYESLDRFKSKQHWEKALDRSPRGIELILKYAEATQKEDLGRVIEQLKEMHRLYPDAPGLGAQLAAVRLQDGDEGALELIEELAADFPYSYEVQFLRAAVAELFIPYDSKAKRVAIRHYQQALSLHPGDFDTRDKLRGLTGRKPVSEILPPIDLESCRQEPPDALEYPGADACVLAEEVRRILFADGSNYAEDALLIKVFTDYGCQRFSTLHTGVHPLFSDVTIREARTLKADGRQVEAQHMHGRVAFQNLAPGDIIELHHSSSSWLPGELNREFWDSHLFQWDVPCLRSQYALLIPVSKRFWWRVSNHDDAESMETSRDYGDFTLYTWKMEDIPARDAEIHTPPAMDVSPWLDLSTIEDWSRIVEWYSEISEEPCRADPRIEQEVREILAGVDAGSDSLGSVTDRRWRIAQLYDFVANQVACEDRSFQYSAYIPEPAPDVLHSRYGDCKDQVCLLRSMLWSIDVESYFALVSPITLSMGSYLPSPRFAHAILAIPSSTGPGYWFLDPTVRGMPAAYVPESLQGVKTLVIRPGVDALGIVPSRDPEDPTIAIETDARIDRETDLVLARRQVRRSGDEIALARSIYSAADEDKRLELLTNSLGRMYVGLEVWDPEWTGLEPGADSLSVSYEMRLRNVVSRSGDLRLVSLPWRSSIDDRFAMVVAGQSRDEPLFLYGLWVSEEERLRLTLPHGWSIQGSPESQRIECAHGFFTVDYAWEGRTLMAHRILWVAGRVVSAAEYPRFKRFVEDVIREQDLVLVLAGQGAGEVSR